jgi:hypothetical protein
MGIGKFIFSLVVAWLIFRWLDFLFGKKPNHQQQQPPRQDYRRHSQSAYSKNKKPNSDNIGDYVDFEEVDD